MPQISDLRSHHSCKFWQTFSKLFALRFSILTILNYTRPFSQIIHKMDNHPAFHNRLFQGLGAIYTLLAIGSFGDQAFRSSKATDHVVVPEHLQTSPNDGIMAPIAATTTYHTTIYESVFVNVTPSPATDPGPDRDNIGTVSPDKIYPPGSLGARLQSAELASLLQKVNMALQIFYLWTGFLWMLGLITGFLAPTFVGRWFKRTVLYKTIEDYSAFLRRLYRAWFSVPPPPEAPGSRPCHCGPRDEVAVTDELVKLLKSKMSEDADFVISALDREQLNTVANQQKVWNPRDIRFFQKNGHLLEALYDFQANPNQLLLLTNFVNKLEGNTPERSPTRPRGVDAKTESILKDLRKDVDDMRRELDMPKDSDSDTETPTKKPARRHTAPPPSDNKKPKDDSDSDTPGPSGGGSAVPKGSNTKPLPPSKPQGSAADSNSKQASTTTSGKDKTNNSKAIKPDSIAKPQQENPEESEGIKKPQEAKKPEITKPEQP